MKKNAKVSKEVEASPVGITPFGVKALRIIPVGEYYQTIEEANKATQAAIAKAAENLTGILKAESLIFGTESLRVCPDFVGRRVSDLSRYEPPGDGRSPHEGKSGESPAGRTVLVACLPDSPRVARKKSKSRKG